MVEFRGKDLPSKKKEYVVYAGEEWDDLAREKNLSDETMKNIVIEVEKDKVGLEWLERRRHPLAPTQRDVDPAPIVYVEAMAKFAKVNIGSVAKSSALRFSVDVAASPGLSTCPSVRVTCPSVRVSWTGLSSVRLALGLPQGKLGVTLAYMADTSHSKLAPPKHEHAPRLTRRRL